MTLDAKTAEMIRDQQVNMYENEAKNTLKVLKAIPNSKLDFKPHPKSMGMKELAWHAVTAEQMFAGGIVKGGFGKENMPADVPKEAPNSADGIAQAYERLTALRVAELRAAKGETLAKELNFFDVMKMPAINYLQMSTCHSIHHRGQLTVYLRLVDAKVPSTYGPSADDNPFEKK